MNGILAWFARNRVAANLLMLLILLGGFLAITSGVRRELFPLLSLDMVNIRVLYPGATPAVQRPFRRSHGRSDVLMNRSVYNS